MVAAPAHGAANPFGGGFPDWSASQAFVAAAPRVCYEVGTLLAQAGHALPDAAAIPPTVALLLQAKDTSDRLCTRLIGELQVSKAALGTVAGWLEEAAGLQQVVDAHCLALGAQLSTAASIKTRVTGCPSALAGVQLAENGVLGQFLREAPAAPEASASAATSEGGARAVVAPPGAAASAAPGGGVARVAATAARAAVAAAATVRAPATASKVASALAGMGDGFVPTTPAAALPAAMPRPPFNAFGGSKAAPARPTPTSQPPAGAVVHRTVSPPRAAALQHTKACLALESVDWRVMVVWTRSDMPTEAATSWMQEAGHKWGDIWWDLAEFGRLADAYRGLVAPKYLARTVFDAVGRSKAVRLKGWLNVTDVVAEVGRHGKGKRLSAFDVFAAGAGQLGLPRDIAYAQVIIPGKKSGTFSTSVFLRITSSFVNDLAGAGGAVGSAGAEPGRSDWKDQPPGGVWEQPSAETAAPAAYGGGGTAWEDHAGPAAPATFGSGSAPAWDGNAQPAAPATHGGGDAAAWGSNAEANSWSAGGSGTW